MNYTKPAILGIYPANEMIQGTDKITLVDNPGQQSSAGAYEADE